MKGPSITVPPFLTRFVPAGAPHPDGCAARGLLDRLGDKWSLLVVAALQDGPVRFNALKRRIDIISQRLLTRTLRSLERDGFVARAETPKPVTEVSYSLTPLGDELVELTALVVAWAAKHDAEILAARERFDRAGALT